MNKDYKRLEYLAYHDSLTGLLNRNWLYDNINNINYKYVYFLDINDLKEINKKGHKFGDEYILDMVNSINVDGVLIRYGGDEFLLFSNESSIIESNNIYSVGCSEIKNNIPLAIHNADIKMLKIK